MTADITDGITRAPAPAPVGGVDLGQTVTYLPPSRPTQARRLRPLRLRRHVIDHDEQRLRLRLISMGVRL
ncbi:hypothetical protein [Streptomyces lasiicapitis]|uniref:Uncharacterized protein n=1 Tax=Streptomyces lasiicapitis TaxID=1923961 RepID=A0ABQ2N1S0_9ACTN|nr:hypothetical protein [Streptomyces lasiicapitis]GGO60110.1 hypothetical protein GCM10012286_83250 [Streptomyces lasiicapitis]